MEFIQCKLSDIDEIFGFYDIAVAFQKKKFNKHWQPFDIEMIRQEIKEGRHWKIIVDRRTACVFVVAYSDPYIWIEDVEQPAIYLHRIVSHPDFRGSNFVNAITDWAIKFAKEKCKKFVRLDTWADNEKLGQHYLNAGFKLIGFVTPGNSGNLPKHYDAISLGLFEIEV